MSLSRQVKRDSLDSSFPMIKKSMTSRILLLAFMLAALVGSGCSRKSSSESAAVSGPPINLGAVELAYGVPARQDLGGKNICIITAQSLDRDSIEITAVLEKSGKQVATTRALPVKIGVPLELSFGEVRVQLTPQIKGPG